MRVERLSMKVASDSKSIVCVYWQQEISAMCSKYVGRLGWADSNSDESPAGSLLPNWAHCVCNELKRDTPRCVQLPTMCWTF